MKKPASNFIEVDAIVIGGGFGGCYSLYRLRELGLKTTLLEAGDGFGGVWHWNRYPGARVDSEVPTYQFNIHKVWRRWNWTERFPSGEELRDYFRHVDQTLDLSKDAIFNTIVTGVQYNPETRRWSCTAQNGLQATCRYLVAATGSSYKKYYPSFPGLDHYKGRVIHPADYPADLNVQGKRVGVVGNGGSGLQVVQELAKQDCDLKVFVRTPAIALPMNQRKISPEESDSLKGLYQAIFEKCYRSQHGFPHNANDKVSHQATAQETDELFEELWNRGGFNFLTCNFCDYMMDERTNAMVYDYWARRVRARMSDPAKMDIVAPLKQPFFIGTKRPSLEQDYYEMVDRPNVQLHDLKQSPIIEMAPEGIITQQDDESQLHELDVIIFATGYDALTGSLLDMGIEDKNSQALADKWKKGVLTHLGIMIPDMPNLFAVYGPQAPTSLANGPPFIEMEVDWICKVIAKMQAEGLESIEPTLDAAKQWGEQVVAASNATLLPRADSWYFGANIPGKRREPLIYLGGLQRWWQQCLASLENWNGFEVKKIN